MNENNAEENLRKKCCVWKMECVSYVRTRPMIT